MSSCQCKRLEGAIFPFQVEPPPGYRTMNTCARGESLKVIVFRYNLSSTLNEDV